MFHRNLLHNFIGIILYGLYQGYLFVMEYPKLSVVFKLRGFYGTLYFKSLMRAIANLSALRIGRDLFYRCKRHKPSFNVYSSA